MLLDVNHRQRRYDVRNAGVLITPHTLASGDNGTVIVAASFVHTDHNIRFTILILILLCHIQVANGIQSRVVSGTSVISQVTSHKTDDRFTNAITDIQKCIN